MQKEAGNMAISEGLEQALTSFMEEKEREYQQVDEIQKASRNPRKSNLLISEFVENVTGRNPAPASNSERKVRAAHRPNSTVHIVKLGVRRKHIALNEIYTFESSKISRLEARLDAEKAAREAGYPIVGYLYSIERV